MKKSNRFEVVHKDGGSLSIQQRILVDKQTGVNYLYVSEGYGGGLTVLLDKTGKPVISPVSGLPNDF